MTYDELLSWFKQQEPVTQTKHSIRRLGRGSLIQTKKMFEVLENHLTRLTSSEERQDLLAAFDHIEDVYTDLLEMRKAALVELAVTKISDLETIVSDMTEQSLRDFIEAIQALSGLHAGALFVAMSRSPAIMDKARHLLQKENQ